MDRKRAAELLPVIQAFAEGKAIQKYYKDGWINVGTDNHWSPELDAGYVYRIKPEPFECWVNVYDTGLGFAYSTKKGAVNCNHGDQNGRTIHMREVDE